MITCQLTPRAVQDEPCQLGQALGKGVNGEVHALSAYILPHAVVKTSRTAKSIEHEAEVLSDIHHPNVVAGYGTLLGPVLEDRTRRLYLSMERLHHSLLDRRRSDPACSCCHPLSTAPSCLSFHALNLCLGHLRHRKGAAIVCVILHCLPSCPSCCSAFLFSSPPSVDHEFVIQKVGYGLCLPQSTARSILYAVIYLCVVQSRPPPQPLFPLSPAAF